MGITVTLDKIKEKFDEWHNGNDNYNKIHKATNDRIDAINNQNENNEANINKIKKQMIKLINGSPTNEASNEVDNAYSSNNSINLKSLQDSINIIKAQIGITNANTTVADLIQNMLAPLQNQINSIDANPSHHYHKWIMQQELQANDDLNNKKSTGLYRCDNISIASSISNQPTTQYTPFFLITLSGYSWNNNEATEDNQIIRQFFVGAYGSDTKGDVIYTRHYNQGLASSAQWSSWSELFGTHNTNVVQMSVEFTNTTGNYYLLERKH